MFHAGKHAGPNDFATFYEALPIPRHQKNALVSKFLDVTPRTVTLWLSGERCPPKAAVAALFHESHYGQSARDTHAQNGHQIERGLNESLRNENTSLRHALKTLQDEISSLKASKATGENVPMNDSFFDFSNAGKRKLTR